MIKHSIIKTTSYFILIGFLFTFSSSYANHLDFSNNELESDSIHDLMTISEEAYSYAFPMIIGYKVLLDFFVNKESGQYKGPINVFTSEARVFTPDDTVAAAVNSDTPYGFAMLDLRAEPIVVYLPTIEKKRYYNVQLVDMYTDNYAYMGSRTTGNEEGYYLIAAPDWEGEKPKGIKEVFRCETQFSMSIFRVQLFGPDDMPNVKKIQEEIKVIPLSTFLKKPAPAPAPEIDWLAFKPEGFTSDFVDYLNFVLQFCPATGTAAVEKPMRERFSLIGVDAGEKWNPKAYTPEQLKAMAEGVKSAFKKINHEAENVGNNINGWRIGAAQGNRDFYNGNWVLRAAAAKNGIYGNDADEATYPIATEDENGLTLDASKHNYTITFQEGQLPPVKAFWSITLYNERSFLVNNPINRYLINSAMYQDMKKNADGSVTIHVQHKSPGKNNEANWLPTPDGVFYLVMRLYWPEKEGLSVLPPGEGTWTPPAIIPATVSILFAIDTDFVLILL